MTYKNYFVNKYKNYKMRKGKFLALFLIIVFAINKLVCYLLINFISKKSRAEQLLNKEILFIEPVKQGFGDLLFQTSLLKSWSEKEYLVNILLAKKEHSDIIKNNIYVNRIFGWNTMDLFKILFTNYGSIVGLCRNSIRENFLLIAKISCNKNLLDFDLALWENAFSTNPSAKAWQIITNNINSDLNSRGVPQIFFSEQEKKYISENRRKQIVMIAGVKDKFKQMPILENFLLRIPNNLLNKIVFIGRGENNIGKLFVKNLINKLTYREAILEIASASFVFGPEGSLVHVASVLGIKTAIWDPKRLFIKNAHPSLLKRGNLFFIYSEKDLQNVINYMNLSSVEN